MPPVTQAARWFALLNVAIGIAGFTGPLVAGNRDRIINIRPGMLLGIVAINWLHALLHLGFGLLGLTWASQATSARRYMRLDAAVFAALSAMGLWRVRGQSGIHLMMGMAIDRTGNVIHAGWTALGLAYTLHRDT